jgi:superfamily II DNA/RNA helicase
MSAYNYRTKYNKNRNQSYSSRRPSQGGSKKRGQYIDPARFVKSARPLEEQDFTPENNFTDLNIATIIKDNLALRGFTTLTPIQDKSIPPALEGLDIVGIADTGTGKTTAFGVPVINKLLANEGSRALIIAPTRELAQQIEEEIRLIAKGSGIYGAILIGGASYIPQFRDLDKNPQIVIGTPGRIKDHLERQTLRLDKFNIVVLDEVDRMLDMGFVGDITEILGLLEKERQSLFYSATLDARVRTIINQFSSDPVSISIKSGETSENVHQNVVDYNANSEKIEKLHDILNQSNVTKALVFDETQRSVENLSQQLIDRGFTADSIHGGKSQGQRQRALSRFKKNEINILVATDVAARGIDVPNISHVINYSQPQSYQDYIHRIGRAGRAGKIGHALTFVSR